MNKFKRSFNNTILIMFGVLPVFVLVFGILSASAQVVNIPDTNFLKALIAKPNIVDKNMNGMIELSEAETITSLNISSKSIKNLAGIENFIALDTLYCSGNQLSSINISKNTALTYLNLQLCGLTSLDVSHNTALKTLYCHMNNLTSLDVNNNTALTLLNCSQNQLTRLDVTKNIALSNSLDCGVNQLTQLDVTNNVALVHFHCEGNKLTSLDISKNLALKYFSCHFNSLTNLDVSKNINLLQLFCLGNQLTTLDVSENKSLNYLACDRNKIKYLNLSNNLDLATLYCEQNQLIGLDLSKNNKLEYLQCDHNKLISLDLSKNIALQQLYCNNNMLTSLNLFNNTLLLDTLYSKYSGAVNCSSNPNLYTICINPSTFYGGYSIYNPFGIYNQVTNSKYWTKDASATWSTSCSPLSQFVSIPDGNFQKALIANGVDKNNDGLIEVSEAQTITSLTVSNDSIFNLRGIEWFTSLDSLDCSRNQLTSLDLTQNKNLKWLNCSVNQLTSVTLSNDSIKILARLEEPILNSTLTYLDCGSNLFSELDVSTYVNLDYLDCSSNPNLQQICINTNQENKEFSWTKDAKATWSTGCGIITSIQAEQIQAAPKVLIRILTILGQEIKSELANNGLFIYQYSDGSTRKVMKKD